MFEILSQPYPVEESIRRRFVKSVAISGFIGLFLLVFQPFGSDDWQTPFKSIKLLGFGLVTFVVMTVDSFLLPLLFPHYFSNTHWTVRREIVRTTLFIFVVAICNRFYLNWLLGLPSATGGLVQMVGMTFLIGIFPTVGTILISYIVQLRRYSRSAAELPDYSDPATRRDSMLRERVSAVRTSNVPETILTLVADNEKDTLIFRPGALLFIESSDNYCTVVHLKSTPNGLDQPFKSLLRSSLSRLEGQIAGQPHIVRCHRSFVVNLDRVERVTGNAQGYKLHLFNGQFQVPVARRFNDSLIAQLKSLM